MSQRVERVVLFPRYTAFIGTTALYSGPVDVRDYAGMVLTAWMGTGLGTTPAEVEFTLQQSPDLENWSDAGSLTPDAGEEETDTFSFQYPWMRVKAVVSGTNPGVTCWLEGELVRREDATGGTA